MTQSSNRLPWTVVGAVTLVLVAWLGAGVWAGQRAEATLRALQTAAPAENASLRIVKLAHQTGLLSSHGKAELAWVDDCTQDLTADGDPQPLASVEYRISHLPWPSSLMRFEWSAAPAGDAAQELRALIGSTAKITGSGGVGLDGHFRSQVALPEISRRRIGLKVAPSEGFIEVTRGGLKFEWRLDRFGLRSAGETIELRGASISIDMDDRNLGTGSYTLGIDKASLRSGTAEGIAVRAQSVARGDRLDTTASYTTNTLSWDAQTLNRLTFDLALTGIDLTSAETLNGLFRSSCGFRNMTADEQQTARRAVARMLTRGLSAGITKLAASSDEGSFDANISIEMTPSSGAVPSLAKQLRSDGELTMVVKELSTEQRQMLLGLGFEPLRDRGLRAQYQFRNGQLEINGKTQPDLGALSGLMGELQQIDQALAASLDSKKEPARALSDALASALPPLGRASASVPTMREPAFDTGHEGALRTACQGDYDPTTWTACTGSRVTAAGDRYSGGYLNGKAHGQGTYTFTDGRKYVGQYDLGVRQGSGTEFRADGSIALQGLWDQGQFVKP